jgi:hypothetical protein
MFGAHRAGFSRRSSAQRTDSQIAAMSSSSTRSRKNCPRLTGWLLRWAVVKNDAASSYVIVGEAEKPIPRSSNRLAEVIGMGLQRVGRYAEAAITYIADRFNGGSAPGGWRLQREPPF